MGEIGPTKSAIAGQIDTAKHAYIEERRSMGTRSRSEYLAAIVDYWFDQGCPQLPIEKPVTVLPYLGEILQQSGKKPRLKDTSTPFSGTEAARKEDVPRK